MYITEKIQDFSIIKSDKPRAEIELTNIDEMNKLLQELITENQSKIIINFY